MHKLIVNLVILALVGFMVYSAYQFVLDRRPPQVDLLIGSITAKASVFHTDEARTKALDTTSWPLGDEQFGLLVYDVPDRWVAYMPERSTPRDFIWLSENKKVIYFVKKAMPDSEPHREYRPFYRTKYLIIAPAGTIDRLGIRQQSKAQFDLSEIVEIVEDDQAI